MKNRIKEFRAKAGLRQHELAELVGVGVPQVSRWESGQVDIPSSRLVQIAAALDCSIFNLLDSEEAVFDQIAAEMPNGTPVRFEGASAERLTDDLPVYGSARGGSTLIHGESVEQTYLNTGEIIHYAKRPTVLNGRADAYGLYVFGDSMTPVYMEGDMVLAETKRPPRIGDDVIVYFRPDNPIEDDGQRSSYVLIKRLIRRTSSFVELEQFNPPKHIQVPVEEIIRIDRVLRLVDLLG